MKATEFFKEKLNSILIGFAIVLVVLFFKQCSVSSKVSDLKKSNLTLQSKVDSLTKEIKDLEKSQVTSSEYQKISERTMYQFLIYEEDIDKGKISLSEVQLKLKENDTK